MTNDNIASKFIWAGDNLLALQQGNNSFSYVADANKNVRQLIDNTNGNVVASYEYTPFGKLFSSDEQIAQPFKFSSEYADTETNLVYYNYRYYNPELGRWLTRDPIGEFGGWDLYNFVYNESINAFDNLGLTTILLPRPILIPRVIIPRIAIPRITVPRVAIPRGPQIFAPEFASPKIKHAKPKAKGKSKVKNKNCPSTKGRKGGEPPSEHTKGKSKIKNDKHTKKRAGDVNQKKRQNGKKRGKKWTQYGENAAPNQNDNKDSRGSGGSRGSEPTFIFSVPFFFALNEQSNFA